MERLTLLIKEITMKKNNPQPSTLNPQPSTLNPQPSTLNPQPSTLNPQPSTLNQNKLAVCGSITTKEFFMKRIFSLSIYFPFLLILVLSALVMTFSGCGLFEPGNASLEEKKFESDHDDATGGEDLIDCDGDGDDTPTTSGNNLVYFGTLSGFNYPLGVTVADDKLYVTDGSNHQVKIYNNLAGIPNLERTLGVAGTIKMDNTGFNLPNVVAVADGRLYVSEGDNHRVQIYNLPIVDNDEADVTIGTGTAVTMGNTGFNHPASLVIANGKLYVSDYFNNRIQIYNLPITASDEADATIGTGTQGTGTNQFYWPVGMVITNDRLYVGDSENHRIQIYNNLSGTPTYERTLGTGAVETDNTGFNGATHLAIANDRLYVSDHGNHRVQIYTNLSGVPAVERTLGTGAVETDSSGFHEPTGVAVHGSKLYVVDRLNNRVQIFEWR